MLCCTAFNYVSASTVVDYKEIEDYVKDNRSDYDALVGRFVSADTTLTNDEIAKIYYGNFFTGNFSPYATNDGVNKAFKNKDYAKAFKMSQKLLKSNPVALDILQIYLVSSKALNKEVEASNAQIRFNQIVSMILDSGEGSEESPFKVICIADEYAILRTAYRIKEFKGQALTNNLCDKMTVVLKGNETPVSIYFDISLPFKELSKALKQKDRQ